MGEYAEYELQREMRRGIKTSAYTSPITRNPVATYCPECGKGIRPIAGQIRESMNQHMKAKHKTRG